MTRQLVLSFALAVFLSACAVAPTVQQPEPDNSAIIASHLRAAEKAFEQNQLTSPRKESAYYWYKKVLALDPGNVQGRDGISRIVEQYLAWALDYADQGNLPQARQFVARAESVDPSHPNIEPVVNKINDREDSIVRVYNLDSSEVRGQVVSTELLDQIAYRISLHKAFVTIRAPDDRSGRWLYQALNSRTDFRLEASFERSPSASVSVHM